MTTKEHPQSPATATDARAPVVTLDPVRQSAVVKLAFPIEWQDEEGRANRADALDLRRLTIGDVEAVQRLDDEAPLVSYMLILLARTSGLPREAIEQLSIDDYKAAQGVLLPQLGKFDTGLTEIGGETG